MKETDLKTLEAKGISEEQIQKQLDAFKTGFPYLNIEKAAAIGDGIARYEETEQEKYLKEWEDYLGEGHRVVKFVPASGAASRMFKNLFEYLNQPYELPKNEFEVKFFTELKKFAFYEDLDKACKQNEGKDIEVRGPIRRPSADSSPFQGDRGGVAPGGSRVAAGVRTACCTKKGQPQLSFFCGA